MTDGSSASGTTFWSCCVETRLLLQGPRQDAGMLGPGDNPGISLVQRIYNYVQQTTKGASKVMVSGVRSIEGDARLAPEAAIRMPMPQLL